MREYLIVPTEVERTFYKFITSLKVLLSKFQKTIRSGLRMIQNYSRVGLKELPRLNKVNDYVIKSITGSPQGAKVRIIIFEIQRLGHYHKDTVAYAINTINSFNQLKNKEFEQEERRREGNQLDYHTRHRQ
jgi:hypothetical protein